MTRLASFKALSSTTSRQSISTRRSRTTSRPSQAKVGARRKSSTPLWRTMLPGHKTPWSVLSTDVIAATRKKREFKKTNTHWQLSSDSSATFVPRRTPNGAPPRTAHIAISSSVAISQDSSISEVYSSTTLTTHHTAAKGSDHGMR